MILAEHTWGRTLVFHPHVHCLVSAGGLRGELWVAARRGYLVPGRALSALFRGKWLSALNAALSGGELRLPAGWEEGRARVLLRCIAKKRWNVRIAGQYAQGAGVAVYLHDFGSQIGLRLAIKRPQRIAALIIQNGDIYEDQLGPKYAGLQEYFRNPTAEAKAKLAEAVNEEGFKDEFLNDVEPKLIERIPPDLWKLHWPLMTPRRRQIALELIAGLKENLAWFPRYQAYLREQHPPTLIVWGPQDGYMPEGAARAYLRDLPDAELHLLAGGHWLLETHLAEVVARMRDFLGRVHT